MYESNREWGIVEVYCDSPGCTTDYECEGPPDHPPHYADVTTEIRDEGWEIENDNGRWSHFCPDCSEEQEDE